MCDTLNLVCADRCEDGRAPCSGSCCEENQICGYYGCQEEVVCEDNQTLCPDPELAGLANCCDNDKEECDAATGQCVVVCKSNVFCGDVCCEEGLECDTSDNTCKPPCSGTRCGEKGDLCCGSDELCLYQKCLAKGKECSSSKMCTFDEFCEESTMTCVNTDEVPTTCQVIPKFDKFDAHLQWHWPGSLPGGNTAFSPEYNQVMMTPVVINMTDDNNDGKVDENDVPDVLFTTFKWSAYNNPGIIRAISGDDGHEIAATAAVYHGSDDFGAADIDGDGVVELIAATATEIHALSIIKDEASSTGYAWKVKYSIPHGKNGVQRLFASIANLENDGIVDVVTNLGVLNVVGGQFVWKEGCQKAMDRATIADLDGDGNMEIIQTQIWDHNCNVLDAASYGGFVAVADLMPDSEDAAATGELKPELARVVGGQGQGAFQFYKVYKKDGVWSQKHVWTGPIPINKARIKKDYGVDCDANPGHKYCHSGGGPLVIADFNGDKIPDVGVAAKWYYIVYSNDGTPTGGRVLWAHSQTRDYSSAVTGSSVFDFEGDGVAEVVYCDELNLRVYSGPGSETDADGDGHHDPTILYDIPNPSGTLWEYPLIVDVDNDGSTEIIAVANNYAWGDVTGVRAFEDPGGQWVRTRRIWNEHHYHVTNINEDGSVPAHEDVNWEHSKLNNYRQNVQPGGLFNAPNLVASGLVVDDSKCSADPKILILNAKITNEGSLGVKAGVEVNFYAKNANGTGKKAFLGSAPVPTMLLPGGSGMATLDWDMTGIIEGESTPSKINMPADIYFVVDEPTAEKLMGEFVECIENDNTLAVVKVEGCHEDIN